MVAANAADANPRKWAKATNNLRFIGRISVTAYVKAANFYYHHTCYTRLRYEAEKPQIT